MLSCSPCPCINVMRKPKIKWPLTNTNNNPEPVLPMGSEPPYQIWMYPSYLSDEERAFTSKCHIHPHTYTHPITIEQIPSAFGKESKNEINTEKKGMHLVVLGCHIENIVWYWTPTRQWEELASTFFQKLDSLIPNDFWSLALLHVFCYQNEIYFLWKLNHQLSGKRHQVLQPIR